MLHKLKEIFSILINKYISCSLCQLNVEKYDDESGYPYYENQATGEFVWEKPADFDDAVLANGEGADQAVHEEGSGIDDPKGSKLWKG